MSAFKRAGGRDNKSADTPAMRGGQGERDMKYVYLLIPVILGLSVPLYNRVDPQLMGFPFFYWALFLQIPLSVLFIYLAWREESK